MTCEEFLEHAAAYALGVLDPIERSACEAHLRQSGAHHGCAPAVDEARLVAAKLAGEIPGRIPSPRLWRAIEARLGDLPRDPRARRRVWRELAGWFVAAAVVGLYLYGGPLDPRKRAIAVEGTPAIIRDAMTLMTAPGTRVAAFLPSREGAGRATLVLNPGERRALVLCDRTPPAAARQLRLWAERDGAAPRPLAPLTLGEEGVASVQLGLALFGPTAPDRLLISADGPTAMAPTEVLLTVNVR